MSVAPIANVEDAVSVRVEVALPLTLGVAELGENVAVTPSGRPLILNVAAELKPCRLVMVIVLVPLPPWVRP